MTTHSSSTSSAPSPRRRFSPSMVVAVVALVVALGGTSYAALSLPKNSVGSTQIRANAVTSPKVKDGSLQARDFARGQLPKGPKGETGIRGPEGPAGKQGPQGERGERGAAGPFPSSLPSGATVRGVFASHCCHSSFGVALTTGEISFGYTLSAAPTVHYIKAGETVPAGCSGSVAAPGADPGHLCIFEKVAQNAGTERSAFDPTGAGSRDTSSRFGAVVYATTTGANPTVEGSWAVTAP